MNCDKFKVKKEEDWKQEHLEHGELIKEYPKAQPRGYKIYHLVCPCGARLVGMEDND